MATLLGTDIIEANQAKTLTGLVLERARRSPTRPAYVHCQRRSGRWVASSWQQVIDNAGRWQAALRREGLPPGTQVALQMGNRPEWVYFDMAALGLALVTVPLYTNDRPENLRHILQDAGVRLLVLENSEQLQALAPCLGGLELQRILILEPGIMADVGIACTAVADWLGQGPERLLDLVEDPEQRATIVYTSGSTGPPKGVMLSHRNILWDTQASLQCVQAFPQDRFLSFLPLSHTLERTGGYYLPMMAGSTVAYARSIPQLAEDLQLVRPTVLIAVPRIFERIHARIQDSLAGKSAAARRLFAAGLKVGWHRFEYRQGRRAWSTDLLFAPLLDRLVGAGIRRRLGGRLRITVSGGAPISSEVARFFISLGIPLVQGYGLTEASPVVTVCPLENNLPHSVGIPLPGAQLRLGPKNELLVKSPGVMLGYWNQPRATAEVVDADGWLRTGDQGRMEGQHLVIAGRLKELIVLSNGEKVVPCDMENAILLDRLFSQLLILGEGRPYLAALAVLDPAHYAELAAALDLDPRPEAERLNPRLEKFLLERIGARLSAFPGYAKVLRAAVVAGPWSVEEGLQTPTLKLKRNAILRRFQVDIERLYEGHR